MTVIEHYCRFDDLKDRNDWVEKLRTEVDRITVTESAVASLKMLNALLADTLANVV